MLRHSLLCLWVVVLTGCASTPLERRNDVVLRAGGTITAVSVVKGDQGSGLFYKTTTKLGDCLAIYAEVREVWKRIGHAEADRQVERQFTLTPEDPAGRSRGFTYERRGSEWIEMNFIPCS